MPPKLRDDSGGSVAADVGQPARAFERFAAQHALSYVERGGLGFHPGYDRVAKGIVGGPLPNGLTGAIAAVTERIQPTVAESLLGGVSLGATDEALRVEHGGSGTTPSYFRDYCQLVTRVPEGIAFLPALSCRDTRIRGLADRMGGPGGLLPLMEQFELESVEFNHRYRIGTLRTGIENRIRQLFSPSFIDWMAHTAPDGLRFEYWGGLLSVMVDSEIEDVTQIEWVCEIAARISERIRAEAEESRGTGSPDGAFTPQEREARQRLEAQLDKVGFDTPPTDVAAAAKRFAKVAEQTEEPQRSAGGLGLRLLARIFKSSIDRDRANALAFEAVIRAYARHHDLAERSPTDYLERRGGLGLPPATKMLAGTLPGTRIQCELGVLGVVGGGQPVSPLCVCDVGSEWMCLRLTPKTDQQTLILGGIPIYGPDGEIALGEEHRRLEKLAASIEDARLRQYYEISVSSEGDGRLELPDVAARWLLAPARAGKCALVLETGALALVEQPIAITDWSVPLLDQFCADIAPVAQAFGAS